MPDGPWLVAEPYERYMGRWSRLLATEVVAGLHAPAGQRWLDVGCGTGAASEAVLASADPARVLGVDPSAAFVAAARSRAGARASFVVGSADALPIADARVDEVVCGLVLTFVPDAAAALAEMRRAVVAGGRVSGYVWDYADGMHMLRHFWSAAADTDPRARDLHEGMRLGALGADGLRAVAASAGLVDVAVEPVVVPTRFADLEDFWAPFLGGQGPAPAYCAGLSPGDRQRLRDRLAETLPFAPDGSLPLDARAWLVIGRA